MRAALALTALVATVSACEPARVSSVARHAVEQDAPRIDFLPATGHAAAEVFAVAPWGGGEGEVSREQVAAHTGPMALAATPDGGSALLDTVGGRLHLYDAAGRLTGSPSLGLRTADDIVVADDGAMAVLAYRREPAPHHEVLVLSPSGNGLGRLPVPAAATMPTALLVDGSRLMVESRHAYLHALDGSPRLWGRPSGSGFAVRAHIGEEREVVVTARDRQGGFLWETALGCSWPVVQVLQLEGCQAYVGVVVRRIDDRVEDAPAEQATVLVGLRPATGEPLFATPLLDQRVTDSGRPFAVAPDGDLLELVTDDAGATIVRHPFQGGER